jgi:SAM-dependent methyltransferase
MVSTWDANLYLRFSDRRPRPALDLMARVPLENARTVYDLGCGAGNVTQLLHERWPRARMIEAYPRQPDGKTLRLRSPLAAIGQPKQRGVVEDIISGETRGMSVEGSSDQLERHDQCASRSGLKAARSSAAKSWGCSHAAKWPPLSTLLK